MVEASPQMLHEVWKRIPRMNNDLRQQKFMINIIVMKKSNTMRDPENSLYMCIYIIYTNMSNM